MITKLVLIEGCFGPDVVINDESIFHHENDSRSEEHIRNLKLLLLNELINNVDNLSISHFREIGDILGSIDSSFEQDENESHSDTCDQCGNYNWETVYKRVE
jgi:hypothetical protein